MGCGNIVATRARILGWDVSNGVARWGVVTLWPSETWAREWPVGMSVIEWLDGM